MPKKFLYADEGFKEQLAEFMQRINPKPTGAELEELKKKYEDERAAYIQGKKHAANMG
jgi:hypothetical protein